MAKDSQERNFLFSSNVWPRLNYELQPSDDIEQLQTENDQSGNVAVEHVFRKIREVYGQPPTDIRKVDWKEYGVVFNPRPSPYDFPAFEHERNTTVMANVDAPHSDPRVSAAMVPATATGGGTKDKLSAATTSTVPSKALGSKDSPQTNLPVEVTPPSSSFKKKRKSRGGQRFNRKDENCSIEEDKNSLKDA